MKNPFLVSCESRPSIGNPLYSHQNAAMAPSLAEGGMMNMNNNYQFHLDECFGHFRIFFFRHSNSGCIRTRETFMSCISINIIQYALKATVDEMGVT